VEAITPAKVANSAPAKTLEHFRRITADIVAIVPKEGLDILLIVDSAMPFSLRRKTRKNSSLYQTGVSPNICETEKYNLRADLKLKNE